MCAPSADSVTEGLRCSGQLGKHLKSVPDDAVIRGFEKRRFRVGVDDNDDFGLVDSSQMLNRSTDPCGNVKIGPNGDAGLADVLVVRSPTDIADWAAAGSGGAQGLGQFLDDAPVLGAFQSSPC